MDAVGFHRDPTAVSRAALALKRVHGIGRAFRSRFGPFSPIDYYLGLLRGLRTPLPAICGEVMREAEAVRRALETARVPATPCHNDTCPENFVEVGDRVYLIDWEYSGMNDPMWDLANLSMEAGFDPEQDRTMMEVYCGATVPPGLYDRVVLQKAMSDYFWGLWSVVQHANDNPAADFWAYAVKRFERCGTSMGSDEFGSRLDAVSTGHKPG
jgi:thiamine kinase-like enzyme